MGKFQPGNKASPGRPKGSGRSPKIRELLEPHVPEAITALVAALQDSDGRVVVQAAKEILTRVYGVPVQAAQEVEADDRPIPDPPQYFEIGLDDPLPAELEQEIH